MVKIQTRRFEKRRREEQIKSRRGRGGKKLYSLRLRLSPHPVKIHLQRPDKPYRDRTEKDPTFYWWLHGHRHYVKKVNKYFECARPDGECIVCAYKDPSLYELDMAPNSSLNWASDYRCVSGWVEEWYHVVERTREKDGNTTKWKERELCKGRGCSECAKKNLKVFGNRFYLDVSPKAWAEAIGAAFEEIERNTKDGGYLVPESYVCEHCQGVLFDWACSCECGNTDLEVDTDKHQMSCPECGEKWGLLESNSTNLVEKLAECEENPCPHCGEKGYPEPKLAHSDGAEEWEPYDIYDVQLTIRKTGEAKQSEIFVDDWEIRSPDERLFNAKYQGSDEEIAQNIANRHKECLNLEDIHVLDTPAVQARDLDVDNVFSTSTSSGDEHREYLPQSQG